MDDEEILYQNNPLADETSGETSIEIPLFHGRCAFVGSKECDSLPYRTGVDQYFAFFPGEAVLAVEEDL